MMIVQGEEVYRCSMGGVREVLVGESKQLVTPSLQSCPSRRVSDRRYQPVIMTSGDTSGASRCLVSLPVPVMHAKAAVHWSATSYGHTNVEPRLQE